jgi:hypothetical protein
MKPFELNNLPQYSDWISELLSGSNHRRLKDQQQIIREFGQEKWGFLLGKWKDNHCGVDVVRSWENSPESVHAGLINDQLMLMTGSESHDYYVSLVEHALLEDPSRHLVEIGCGYGSILFDLLERGNIKYDSIMGLEYTQQGVELAQNLASWHKYEVTIGQGDFNATNISNLEIRPYCDIITSYAFHYVRDSALALSNIIKLNPRRVLHFEPIFQHYKEQTILGLLQKRYLEINDYNSSLQQEMMRLVKEKTIELIKEEPLIFGGNCLLPASLLIWRPRHQQNN